MRRKRFYVLALMTMLGLAASCGKNTEDDTSGMKQDGQVTEAVQPTEEPSATATPEPTATPAPTATPVPQTYMEKNDIEVLGAGSYIRKGFIANEADANGDWIMELADCEYSFDVEEVENEGGTRIIQVTLNRTPHVYEDGGWSAYGMGGFVDLKTGKAFTPYTDELQTILLKQENESHELQLLMERVSPSVIHPYYTERYTLVCPSDYDDAGFYITGWDLSEEPYVERIDNWRLLNFIRHGESDMVVFGVNKGLETIPEKKTVDGAELAEENYFEAEGLSAKGEGTYTWLGTKALRRWNEETGRWCSVSLEEEEIITTISITEESLGNGTKQIKWQTIEVLELTSEDEVKVPYKKSAIADKMTGLVYHPRTYNLAEPYVLEKDGEEFTIFVGRELVEEELGDGKVKSCNTYTLICPEDYNDAVLVLTAEVEIDEDEDMYSNEAEVFSLNEVEHGEYDLLFFR